MSTSFAQARQHAQRAAAQGAAAPSRGIIHTVDWASLPEAEPPPRRFIIDNWLPTPCLSSLYGPPGVGKSLLAQLLATCVALGRDFLGAKVDQVPVLGIFCEDEDEELPRRQWRINQALDIRFCDLAGKLHLEGAAGQQSALVTFSSGGDPTVTDFKDELVDKALDLGAGLLILDNRGQMFFGNENDRCVATYCSNLLAGIAREIDGAVLLLGHTARSEGSEYSGSSGWDAVTRSRLLLRRVDDKDAANPDQLSLARLKANYARPDEVPLIWRNGVLVSVDPRHMSEDERKLAELRRQEVEVVFLQALDAAAAQGRNLSHAPQAQNYAPKSMLVTGPASGFGKRELEDAMHRLLDKGEIIANAEVGRAANRHRVYGLARAPAQGS